MKVTEIRRLKNWGTWYDNSRNASCYFWHNVADGERYDCVQFKVGEIATCYWGYSIACTADTTDEELEPIIHEYADKIPEDDYAKWASFIRLGEKFGWD